MKTATIMSPALTTSAAESGTPFASKVYRTNWITQAPSKVPISNFCADNMGSQARTVRRVARSMFAIGRRRVCNVWLVPKPIVHVVKNQLAMTLHPAIAMRLPPSYAIAVTIGGADMPRNEVFRRVVIVLLELLFLCFICRPD
jgi:hypothetical protein